jgi:hypothetical protein
VRVASSCNWFVIGRSPVRFLPAIPTVPTWLTLHYTTLRYITLHYTRNVLNSSKTSLLLLHPNRKSQFEIPQTDTCDANEGRKTAKVSYPLCMKVLLNISPLFFCWSETFSEDSLIVTILHASRLTPKIGSRTNFGTLSGWPKLDFRPLIFWRRKYIFLILAHPVYKMWIIQEPNTLELWNKLHFEKGKKTENIYHV